MNHKGTKTIETQNLLLRKFDVSDYEQMYKHWAGDSQLTQYASWGVHDSKRTTKKLLEHWQIKRSNDKIYRWGVEDKASQALIGEIHVKRIVKKIAACELEFLFAQSDQRIQLGAEAVRTVTQFLFDSVQADRVQVGIDVEDKANQAILEACHYQEEGVQRRGLANNRGIVDRRWFGMIKEDKD
ncbi:GNAT family protein [Aerococcus sp. UMB8608]|uniref:GNAT family N-acetyltransferase n=1 Tax=Aerococcus sanguinicola TaxID=119206 RepID=A0A5N1GI95_9LACT|nr:MULTISPECIES: GNAT family protein [Aerococcus]KAA9300492.1 GNAT family N-acetyltransferase [Aerococcus sanguinicola]MDK6369693.1 GNAT family protein [Aerococcus sp. UMB9870]MDK6680333.1 GNAT family protein [Aerococcus sp. UMB8608]MDK6686912.1 GNAT family protein [Aerococcus sp. UMB8623]MDK6940024.1 GNAT family protein [Aerococcus sp. UMB8487]